jgi:type IV pilus assembly protein PilE
MAQQAERYRWPGKQYCSSNNLVTSRQIGSCQQGKVDMKFNINRKGFSLIELMTVITIVAILVALAVPSYTQYVRKANRSEAQELLLNWSNNQEIWRATHTTYADGTTALGVPTNDKYTFTVAGVSATSYLLTATATGNQAADTDKGISCTVLTLNESNIKTHANCW